MAGEDQDYTRWLRRQACCVPGCRNKAEAHHPRHDVGGAMKAHDHRAIPLCHLHHVLGIHQLTDGYFGGWQRERVRAFCDAMAAVYRSRYLAPPVEAIPF